MKMLQMFFLAEERVRQGRAGGGRGDYLFQRVVNLVVILKL